MVERFNSAEKLASLVDNVEPDNVLGVTDHSISICIEDSEDSILTIHKTKPSTWYIPAEYQTEEIWIGSHPRLTKIWMSLSREELLNNRS